MSDKEKIDWKSNGVRVIPADSLDQNTPQTSGLTRAAAIDYARVVGRLQPNRLNVVNRVWPTKYYPFIDVPKQATVSVPF